MNEYLWEAWARVRVEALLREAAADRRSAGVASGNGGPRLRVRVGRWLERVGSRLAGEPVGDAVMGALR